MALPKLKKKLKSFLTKEDGKISKEHLIKAGAFVMAAAVASAKDVQATTTVFTDVELYNEYPPIKYEEGVVSATHNHAIVDQATHSSY